MLLLELSINSLTSTSLLYYYGHMDKNASELGKKCLRKYGRDFYREIQAKRKTHKGRKRKPVDQLSASGLAKRKARGLPLIDPEPPRPKGYYY